MLLDYTFIYCIFFFAITLASKPYVTIDVSQKLSFLPLFLLFRKYQFHLRHSLEIFRDLRISVVLSYLAVYSMYLFGRQYH